uniref:Uncharacterized protein n=1 Tax=Anguilla anguilla TaxID=7936 RepID=A0A0E9U0N9_ANGAN
MVDEQDIYAASNFIHECRICVKTMYSYITLFLHK